MGELPEREAEFTAHVAARRAHLRRTAFLLCGDWHGAEDLVQITLSKLFAAWPRVHRGASPDAYARTISHSCPPSQSFLPGSAGPWCSGPGSDSASRRRPTTSAARPAP